MVETEVYGANKAEPLIGRLNTVMYNGNLLLGQLGKDALPTIT
jgi:hypothetical protein